MKKFLAVILFLIGLATASVTVYLSLQVKDSQPVLLAAPEEARNKVVMLMDAVCAGNYEEASCCIYGEPGLGVDRKAGSDVGILIWDAFQNSMSYELVGDCYTTDQGLAQDITVTCLDIGSVTERLRERSQTLLKTRVEEAADVSDIYDEDNEYREEVVMEVLREAVEAALKEDGRNTTVKLTVGLRYREDQWWVIADEVLLNAISGGILY